MRRVLTDDIRDELERRYPLEGRALGAVFGVRPETVVSWASRFGIRKQRFTINEDYFRHWSAAMSYDLGYLHADGNIDGNCRRLRLECSSNDECILESLKRRLGSTSPIKRRMRAHQASNTMSSMSYSTIDSLKLVRCLVEMHGIVPRKSFIDPPFPNIPQEFLPHYLRGLLDGDGCVSTTIRHIPMARGRILEQHCGRIEWLGTLQFMRGLKDAIHKSIDVSDTALAPKRKNLLRAVWCGIKDLTAIARFIYPIGEYPFLARKREKLESFLSSKGISL